MNLEDWMKENVPENGLTLEQVITEFVPFFSSAIQQMQKHWIAHNDLNPENILKCDNVWKVTNFERAQLILAPFSRGTARDVNKVGAALRQLIGSHFDKLDPKFHEYVNKLEHGIFKTLRGFNKVVKKILQLIKP